MVVPNYTYLKLKMPGPNGIIIIEGSFEQAYYCEQDCITQATTLSTPYGSYGSDHDTGKASAKEGTKAATALDRPSIGETPEGTGGSGGLDGLSI